MLEEALAAGDQALVFTQFAEMGDLLARAPAGRASAARSLFLHGGTPQTARDEMVARFQAEPDGPPLFVLSLKAGGTGLNLTRGEPRVPLRPLVEPGGRGPGHRPRVPHRPDARNVQVHKFVCVGTLEEQIDEMIERKQALAERIVGTGEAWLTELDTAQLRELVTLSQEAVAA